MSESREKISKPRVINISNRILTDNETKLLKKGLQFVPFNSKIDKLNIAAATEQALHKAQSKDNSVISLLNNETKTRIVGRNNLTIAEIQALKALQKDQTICILEADKGKSIVVMDKTDYEAKLNDIVLSDTYEQVPINPSTSIDNKIRNIVTELKKLPDTPRDIASKLIGHNSRDPGIYGAPKVHKQGVPLRPIVTTYGTVFENCSRYIASILKHYQETSQTQTALKNSYELKSFLKATTPQARSTLVSFDVVNMFGSIDQITCKQVVMDIVRSDANFEAKFNIPLQYFEKLLDICISSSFFVYKDKCFEQRKGLPMGSSCSPVLADLYLRNLERQILNLLAARNLTFWKRYMDDVISSWTGTRRQLDIFLKEINGLDIHIQFTMELEENNQLPFLDILINRHTDEYYVTMYTKPTDAGIIMNYRSFQPPNVKTSTIKGETIRCKKLSDNLKEDLPKLEEKFENNGYPKRMVSTIIEKTVPRPMDISEAEDKRTNLCLPYMGKLSHKIQKVAKNNNLRLTSQKTKSLGSMFGRNFKQNTSKPTNVIYKIPCTCGEIYVGETSKSLQHRVHQHQNDVQNGDLRNALAVHVDETGHKIDWASASILAYETNWKRRKIKESLYIQCLKPTINIYSGFQLKGDWTRAGIT